MGALIRFYFHKDPDELNDEQFYYLWGDLIYSLRWNQTIKLKDGESIEEIDEDDQEMENLNDIKLASDIKKSKGTYEYVPKKILAAGKKDRK